MQFAKKVSQNYPIIIIALFNCYLTSFTLEDKEIPQI